MPVARFQMPDGRVARFEVPDGTTPAQAQSLMEAHFAEAAPAEKPSRGMFGAIQDVGAGLIRGAGSIGATILTPYDLAAGNTKSIGNPERRAAMDSAFQSMGVDTDSLAYGGGKLGGEIAGTAGIGGAFGLGAKAVGAAPKFVNALTSAGFSTGAPTAATWGGRAADLALRSAAGGVVGGASAGMVDPETAGAGAAVGGALPPVMKGAALLGKGGGKLVGAAGRKLAGEVAPDVQALARRAEELGIQVPADRIANSKPLNAVAAGLNYVPFSGRAAVEKRMQDQLDTALTRTFGQDSPNVTQALRKAQTALGGEFDRVLKGNGVAFDKTLLTDLASVQGTAAKELGSDGLRAIESQIDELVQKGSAGTIDGQAAYNIKRALDRIGQRNTPEAWHARELKKALMSALDRSIGPQEAAKFALTRKQYGNMLDLENLAQNGAEGGVSMARVANMKNLGNPDLQELADIAAQFLRPRESQHGAAQRAFAGMGVGAVAGLPALAGSVAVGRVGNALLDSAMARNALMGKPPTPGLLGQKLNPLAQFGYRTAPVLATEVGR